MSNSQGREFIGGEPATARERFVRSPIRRTRACLVARVAAWVAICLLSGCTPVGEYLDNRFKVGHDYLRPPAPVAEDWIDGDDVRLRKESPDLCNWWQVFQDPVLDGLISLAYEQNLTLREAGFRVLQARAVVGIQVGQLFPQQQDLVGGYSRNAVSKADANTDFLPTRYFDRFNTGFRLSWELDFWGRFRRAVEAADADLDASVEDYDDVLVTLLADVASTYVEYRVREQQLRLVRNNVTLQRETLTLAEARFRGQQTSALDVNQAKSNLAQTEALVPDLLIASRQASNRLCILLGIPPEDLSALLGSGKIPTGPLEVGVGIPAELLSRRPDIRRAERLVAAQNARVGIATSDLYPHISITGTLGWSGKQLDDLLTSRAFQGVVGPGFQWNVLNYGRLLNNIRLQDARLQELIVSYQNTVLVAASEVENGLITFFQSQVRTNSLAESVTAAEAAVEISLAQYRAGAVDFNRIALLEQNLVQQQDVQVQSLGNVAEGLIEVYRALGGGWQIRLESQSSLDTAILALEPGTVVPAAENQEGIVPPKPEPPAGPLPLPDSEKPVEPKSESSSQGEPAVLPVSASLHARPTLLVRHLPPITEPQPSIADGSSARPAVKQATSWRDYRSDQKAQQNVKPAAILPSSSQLRRSIEQTRAMSASPGDRP